MIERYPFEDAVSRALLEALRSPCRSKRGVVLYRTFGSGRREILGFGSNGPPSEFACPGREHCRGKCGDLAVHAEVRALRHAIQSIFAVDLELVHVELDPDFGISDSPRIKPCDGPSCVGCSKQILDSGIVAGVWLYESTPAGFTPDGVLIQRAGAWRRYIAPEFHQRTLERCFPSVYPARPEDRHGG